MAFQYLKLDDTPGPKKNIQSKDAGFQYLNLPDQKVIARSKPVKQATKKGYEVSTVKKAAELTKSAIDFISRPVNAVMAADTAYMKGKPFSQQWDEFKAGLSGDRPDVSAANVRQASYEAKGMKRPDTFGEKAQTFIQNVAFDPLTYVGGLGVLRSTGKGIAQAGLREGIKQGAKTGAKFSGAYAGANAFGNQETPIDVAKQALIGAIAGGTLGGALGGAGAGVGKLAGKLGSKSKPSIKEAEFVDTPDVAADLPLIEGQIPVAVRNGKPVYAAQSIPEVSTTAPLRQQQIELPIGMKERGVSRNIRTDEARPEELRDAISENPMAYDPLKNADTLAKAQSIYDEGLEPAVTKLNKLLEDIKPEAAPLVKLIADDLTKAGNVDRARELLSNAAAKATEAGQFGQAFRILRQADPQTFIMTMDKQIRKLNEQGRELYGDGWKDVDLTSAEKSEISNLPLGDQQAYDDLMGRIGERMANEMPATKLEKFDSWRRMAMLLNPKTHIRNIVGNTVQMGVQNTSDTIAAALERTFLPAGKRTKAVNWQDDQARVDLVNSDWNAIKKEFAGEQVTLKNINKNLPSRGRYEIENLKVFNREKRMFQNDTLEGLSNISRNALNAEDYFFKERAYKNALGGFLKANKLTQVNEAAREYAKRRALEATFQDANILARLINEAKAKGGPLGMLTEAAIPFAKTPTNIAMRALEYSPAGVLRILSPKNAKDPAMVIEILSQGMTGSGIASLGYMLANMGWLRGDRSSSKNAEGVMSAAGEQTNSLVTPLGSYTLDWLQPVAVPLFMGVSVFESLEKQGKVDTDAIAKALAKGGDTIFNMSMLRNIKDLLGGAYGSPTEAIGALPSSYIQQAFPTVFGQTARAVDENKRNTYDTSIAGRFKREIMAKTPFASTQLEPKLDIWGQEQKQAGALQQYLNPGYYAPKTDDAATNEVLRLYKATKETDFLPKLMGPSFTADGVKYELTPEQLTTFQREMGQKNYSDITRMINDPRYANATDEKKAYRISKIVKRNYDAEKAKLLKELKKSPK